MAQGVVSPHQGEAFSRIIGLLVLGLTGWLIYESWLAPSSTLIMTQGSEAQPTIQSAPIRTVTRSPYLVSSPTHEADYSSTLSSLPASELLEQLALWQYHQVNTLSADDIHQIQRDLTQLATLGESAIPAIYQYLNSSQDVDFEYFDNSRHLNQPTLRLALFEVLHRIGVDEAETIWAGELDRTSSPREIAALSRYLDHQAPGAYRESIVAAARQALSLASEDGINGEDAGPLFLVLQEQGNAELADELASVSQLRWGQYAAVALAGLPDGKGITSLVQQVQDATPSNLSARFALQILAQQADYPEAQMALFAGIQQGLIPDYLWPDIAAQLSGTYHIQIAHPATARSRGQIRSTTTMTSLTPGGGQVLHGVHFFHTTLSEEQQFERLRLIESMHEQVTAPAAKRALEQAYDTLISAMK